MNSKNSRIRNLVSPLLKEAQFELALASLEYNIKTTLKEQRYTRVSSEYPELLEEGWKEIILGIAMLADVAMPVDLQAQARKELEGPTKTELTAQIDKVLKDPKAMNYVVDVLKKNGYKDAEEKVKKNAAHVKNELENLEKGEKIVIKTVSQDQLLEKIRQGYAITKVEQDTIKTKLDSMPNAASIIDSINLKMPVGDFFGPGEFVLKPQALAEINSIPAQISKQRGVILRVKITSSTDKQRVSQATQNKLKAAGYAATNQGLSEARNDAVKAAFEGAGINAQIIEQTVLAEQGKGQVGATTPQDPSARYVNAEVCAIKVDTLNPKGAHNTDIVQTVVYQFEITKVQGNSAAPVKHKHKHLHVKTHLGKIHTHSKSPTDCWKP